MKLFLINKIDEKVVISKMERTTTHTANNLSKADPNRSALLMPISRTKVVLPVRESRVMEVRPLQ